VNIRAGIRRPDQPAANQQGDFMGNVVFFFGAFVILAAHISNLS